MANSDLALTGIKVLDISRGFSGGYCTKILRDLGAEVIKVEIPNSGDTCRTFGPFLNDIPDIETSAPYLYLNAGKKSITLDVTNPQARDTFLALCKGSDIFGENFKPGFMSQINLGYDVI